MADVLGAVLEVAANVVLMPSLSAQPRYWRRQWGSRWVHGRRADRFCGGCGDGVHRVTDTVSEVCSDLANMLFPPQLKVTSSPALATHGSTANLPPGRGDCGIAAGH